MNQLLSILRNNLQVIIACVSAAVIVGVLLATCRESEAPITPAPSATASASTAAPDAAPSIVPSTSAAPLEEAPETLAVLPEGDVTYIYPENDGCLKLRSRQEGSEWSLPFPHHMLLKGKIDCGFFTTLQQNKWRTAFCLKGNERKATKLFLMTQGEDLLVRLNEELPLRFTPGECQ